MELPDGVASELAANTTQLRSAPGWLGLGSTTLISLGLAGTFLGLTIGRFEALPHLRNDEVELAINAMLDGAKLAFVKSLAGIGLAMIWKLRLLEVRKFESGLCRHLEELLDQAYPPVSPEHLFASLVQRIDARERWMAQALKRVQGNRQTP